MATVRKKFNPSTPKLSERQVYKEFIDRLLTGSIVASKLVDGKSNGKVDLDYDDPNG